MVTGTGVGLEAFLDCFFGVAKAIGLPRGDGAWASLSNREKGEQ